MSNLQLPQDLLPYFFLGIHADNLDIQKSNVNDIAQGAIAKRDNSYLSSHDDLGRSVHDLGHSSTITGAQFLQHDQILTPEIQPEFQTNLQGIRPGFRVPSSAGGLSIAILGGFGFGGGIQGEAFDILAPQRSGFE